MAGDARRGIEAELRDLRKQPGPLDVPKMVRAQMLTRGLGGDDVETALDRLRSVFDRNAHDPDIAAAVASIDGDGQTVLDRLCQHAVREFVDSRTVRRWSDQGIKKLSRILMSISPWLQPEVRQLIECAGDMVSLGFSVRIPPGVTMSALTLAVNGEPVPSNMSAFPASDTEQRIESPLTPLAAVADLPVKVKVTWLGDRVPTYVTTFRGGGPGVSCSSTLLMASMVTKVTARPGRT